MGIASKQEMVLVVDDDPGMATLVEGLTGFSREQVIRAATLAEGLQQAGLRRFDVVLLDHSLPDGEGFDYIEALLHQDRLRPILYITARSGSRTAIEAIKRGAYEYISKPVDFSLLQKRIAEAIEYRQLTRLPVLVERDDYSGVESDVLVGRCLAMQDVYKAIGRLATLSAPVLIEGEVGTGKEMIARAIHQHGNCQKNPFRIMNADEVNSIFSRQELPSPMADDAERHFESQLNGTLLIEDIGEVTLIAQQRILQWLQARNRLPEDSYTSAMDLSSQDLSARRFIFSTSTPCRRLMECNRLRSDLFYFLSPYIVRVPSLRHRPEDMELLIAHFMQRLVHISSAEGPSTAPRVSSAALNMLKAYDWPGNVAQLKSVLQSVLMESRGVVLATDTLRRALQTQSEGFQSSLNDDGSITPEHETTFTSSTQSSNSSSWNLADFVKTQTSSEMTELYDVAVAKLDLLLLSQVLKMTQGNQAHAARILGMTRTSLRKKIHACQIDPLQFVSSRYAAEKKLENEEEGE